MNTAATGRTTLRHALNHQHQALQDLISMVLQAERLVEQVEGPTPQTDKMVNPAGFNSDALLHKALDFNADLERAVSRLGSALSKLQDALGAPPETQIKSGAVGSLISR